MIKCKECKKPFTPTRKDKIFCINICSRRYYAKRKCKVCQKVQYSKICVSCSKYYKKGTTVSQLRRRI